MSYDHHRNQSQYNTLAMPQAITTSLHRFPPPSPSSHQQTLTQSEPASQSTFQSSITPIVPSSRGNNQNFTLSLQSPFHHPSANVSQNLTSVTSNPMDLQSKKREMELLYSHPLFNLLAIIFQKCELATASPRHSNSINNDVCSAASFNEDIASFAKQFKGDRTFYTSDQELDTVVIQAIQVLRFHLIEIEKVHELCDNFCGRYIEALKTRMPGDLIMNQRRNPNAVKAQHELDDSPAHNQFTVASSQPSNLANWPIPQHQTPAPSSTHSSPLNVTDTNLDDDDDDDKGSKKKKKRGIFPKSATNVMKAWLFQNLGHPYPSEERKRILADETGLTILQVNNWFINARRRIVQPMIDASNRTGKPPVIMKSRRRKPSGQCHPSFGTMSAPTSSHVGPNYGMDHLQSPFYDVGSISSVPFNMGTCGSDPGLNPVVSMSAMPIPHVIRGPTTSTSAASHSSSLYLQHGQATHHPIMMPPPPVRGAGGSHAHHHPFLQGSSQPPSSSTIFQSGDVMTQQILDLHPS